MKKITLFAVAMAAVFTANAAGKLSFGGITSSDTQPTAFFDATTGEFKDEVDLTTVSPYQVVTLGVTVEDATLKAWLAEDRVNRSLVLAPYNYDGANGVDWRCVNFDDRWDNRFTRYGETDTYYINVLAASLFTKTVSGTSDVKPSTGTPWATVVDYAGTRSETPYKEGAKILVENGYLLVAGDVFGVEYSSTETEESGRPKVVKDPWNNGLPAITIYDELGNFFIKFGGNAGKASYNASQPAFGTTVGIADVIADEAGAEVVGYYSILGAKLPGEPASGIYLVKLSNGKTVKLVK
ncbi:MAG: hypothetical protein LBN27_00240 [Prevotellaceae bacterium]|jgi:hypothetical protein|nr:hypothetical protein [Prevotellaceae bacterium]